ncbi:MAG: VOC family protein, partial [Candidatus Hydrogenedentes bacterium]|nr:VOC family protein [Candidatus Hydrogenedentota bacterium]
MKLHTAIAFITATSIFGVWTGDAQAVENYHHVHLTTTDVEEAAAWYGKHLGGAVAESGDRVMFGDVAFVWFKKKEGFAGTDGSSMDHIGFSFADIDSKMSDFEEAGIKIVDPVRELGALKFAFIEDPWGTKIEIIEDPDLLGFHHVHLHTPDPEATLQWYADAFGGEVTPFKGASFLPSIRYP